MEIHNIVDPQLSAALLQAEMDITVITPENEITFMYTLDILGTYMYVASRHGCVSSQMAKLFVSDTCILIVHLAMIHVFQAKCPKELDKQSCTPL